MSEKTIQELENILGDPSEFILTSENAKYLKQWAILSGENPVSVSVLKNVELANLYIYKSSLKIKNSNDKPTNEQIKSSQALYDFLMQQTDYEFIRKVIKEEINKKPSEKLEIITPTSKATLEGFRHYKTETIIKICSINHSIMMVGPAGCGKTTIAEHTAKALNLSFYITSTINDAHELTGFIDGMGKYHTTPFRQAFEYGGIWVADEIDAWDASAMLAANSALANGYCSFPDVEKPVLKHSDFRMIATANTFGSGANRVYVGRNELDAATLDRFAVVEINYDLTLEQMFSRKNSNWLNYVWEIRKKIEEKKIRHVVSSRAISMGATALEIGLKWDEVKEIYLLKGMSENDRKKLISEKPVEKVKTQIRKYPWDN